MGGGRLSPAAAISLNRGCEERPSKRKEGWEVGTEGAGAGAGPPGQRGQQHTGVCIHFFIPKPEHVTAEQDQAQVGHITSHWWQQHRFIPGPCFALTGVMECFKQNVLPLNERSPRRSSSSPPAEAGLVGIVVWITGTTSLPPSRSNKSLACGTRTTRKHEKNSCSTYVYTILCKNNTTEV